VGERPDELPTTVHWPRLGRDMAMVAWPAFLVASVATMICFAFIDPLLVGNDDYPPPAFATRMSGYGLGFFFFWLVASLSSLLTLYLARTARADDGAAGADANGDDSRSSS